MKKIFIVKGKSNTGKTTTINTVAKWIIETYGIPNTIDLNFEKLYVDSKGLLTIGNFKIAINSAGDDLASVKKIETIEYQEADIILCSCRSKGETYHYVTGKFNQNTGYIVNYIYLDKEINEINKDILKLSIERLKAFLLGLPKI